jgi:predicted transcriptional regulator YdeE
MIFNGISKKFSLINEEQYKTIGAFWDEMAAIYGLENLQGLGYNWNGNSMEYAIGLKNGNIKGYNLSIVLPDGDWIVAKGETDSLKELYDEIYKSGALTYEIETFCENGECCVKYYREAKR